MLDITPGNANDVIVASFIADLNGLGGAAAVILLQASWTQMLTNMEQVLDYLQHS